ncbi:uncharacterized protein EDB91DRAFT_1332181 [Suillus paluster]|uniref:uncharacterized protein n=1 Tax=Suillus paluster TaxID=48578 RepID=UPI001B885692|nr:uncharacterized protein EDB91DRAFT_1332181 [Suillus paluster]KAG1756236.1 hypothetical protein EDB91DRAFT_1332181 [Suillus paluster]
MISLFGSDQKGKGKEVERTEGEGEGFGKEQKQKQRKEEQNEQKPKQKRKVHEPEEQLPEPQEREKSFSNPFGGPANVHCDFVARGCSAHIEARGREAVGAAALDLSDATEPKGELQKHAKIFLKADGADAMVFERVGGAAEGALLPMAGFVAPDPNAPVTAGVWLQLPKRSVTQEAALPSSFKNPPAMRPQKLKSPEAGWLIPPVSGTAASQLSPKTKWLALKLWYETNTLP